MNSISLKLKLVAFCLFLISSKSFAQNTQIDCYVMLNQIDKLLVEKDTFTAIRLYECIATEKCILKKGRYAQFSAIYYGLGLFDKSKQEIKKAVESGLMGVDYFFGDTTLIQNVIRNRYGEEMLVLNRRMLSENLEKNGSLIYQLKEIYEGDQALRKNKKYKQCKNYNFRYRLGFPYDTTQNHQEMMACMDEFKQKDSTLLQGFVNIVDSLGFVPGDDILFATIPIATIICHTAHFDFKNLDSLYLKSVELGTISPAVYAWYQGYHEEYFKEDHKLYFTQLEEQVGSFSKEKIEEIDKKRLLIGLPLCPAVIWNVLRY